MAGAGRGARGELDATHGFSGVVSCGHQWFPVKWAGGLQGRHLWEWKGAEREPFLGGVRGPPVEVGRGVLSLVRSVLYLLLPCVLGGGVSGKVGVGVCSS